MKNKFKAVYQYLKVAVPEVSSSFIKPYDFYQSLQIAKDKLKDRSFTSNKEFKFIMAVPINNWEVQNVTNMSNLFCDCDTFNDNISNWDVSNVTYMRSMFGDANAFNQPLNNWNVSNVKNMEMMFNGAINFNQPLNNWDVSNVTTMRFMFSEATSFDIQENAPWYDESDDESDNDDSSD